MLTANLETRTIEGKVLPFGEVGNTNLGAVLASAATRLAFGEPITLNREHDGETFTVGRATLHEVRDDGVYAAFTVDEGPHGDVVLLEAAENRKGLSVEIPDAVIRAGKLLAGTIKAVGAVIRPAFPSALMAADAGDLPPDTEVIEIPDEITVGDITYTRTAPDTEENETMTQPTVEAAENATVDMSAAFGDFLKNQNSKPKPMTAAQAFKAIANGHKSGSLEAALVNVVHDDGDNDGNGLGEISAAPAWLGEVYQNAAYVRRFIPLLTGGTLTSYRELGFEWSTKPTVAPYTGNKAEVPSTGMSATPKPYGTQRWANAADLDRRFIDFGDSDVVRAFVEANIESYREVTDLDALQRTIDAATPVETGDPVTGINAALVRIVDGVLALIANNKRPTSAVVGMADFRSLLLTPKDQIAEFLSQSMGAESGSVLGFQIVPSANADVQDAALVVDKSTVRYKEFGGGSPVRVEAEHIANGGRDIGVFGYTSHQVLNADGIVLVADPIVP